MLHMVGPYGFPFNYSDCMRSFPEKHLSPTLFWFAAKKRDVSLLHHQLKILDNHSPGNHTNERLLPVAIIWSIPLTLAKSTSPQKFFWHGAGKTPVALMRTSWNDEKAIFVGLKRGTAGVSHAHLDIGTFIIDAYGERWAIDLPTQPYAEIEPHVTDFWNLAQSSGRWLLFRYNNLSHNTLIINGAQQQVNGFAPITSVVDSPGFMGAIADLTSIYNKHVDSVKRGVGIVQSSYVIVRDEITGGRKASTLRWTMATKAQVSLLNKKMAVLHQNGKHLYMSVTGRARIRWKTFSNAPLQAFEASNEDITLVGFEVLLSRDKKRSFSVIFSPTKKMEHKGMFDQPLQQWVGVK